MYKAFIINKLIPAENHNFNLLFTTTIAAKLIKQ
jgi:hypothetical protein